MRLAIGSVLRTVGLALLVGLAAPRPAEAQSIPNFVEGILGGLIGEAQRQSFQQAWTRVPPERLQCLRRVFAKGGHDLDGAIRTGSFGPDDQRLAPFVAQCARFSAAGLRSNYPCTVQDPVAGPVQTFCNQSFARQDASGRIVTLTPQEALDAQLDGQAPALADIETEGALGQRRARAEFAAVAPELRQLRQRLAGLPSRASGDGGLAARIDRALADNAATLGFLESARADLAALEGLAAAETARTGAIGRIRAVRAEAERRTAADAAVPEALRSKLKALGEAFDRLLAEGRPTAAARAPAGPSDFGPSFDCANARRPIETLLCSEPRLRRADLAVIQPFYILRHLAPDRQPEFRQDAIQFSRRVAAECRIPDSGTLSAAAARAAGRCVLQLYEKQRQDWTEAAARLGPPQVREEARRAIDQHVRLQSHLKSIGMLAADAKVDGIFGGDTRRAIASFQTREGLAADGIMSDATAERLARAAAAAATPAPAPDGGGAERVRLAAIETGYVDYLAELQVVGRVAAFSERSEKKLGELRAALADIPEPLARDAPQALDATLRKLRSLGPTPSTEAFGALEREAAAVARRAEAAISARSDLTDATRFLLEGPPGDLLVLYNNTPSAPSAAKTLSGAVRFLKGQPTACTAHRPIDDVVFTRELRERLAPSGLQTDIALVRCANDLARTTDLLVLQRGLFLGETVDTIAAILKDVASRRFELLTTISADQMVAARASEAKRAEEIESGLEDGSLQGFGLILVANGSRVVCRVLKGEAARHEASAKRLGRRLADDLKGPPSWKEASEDDTFIALRRGECGGVYAEAPGLARIKAALERDAVRATVVPVWVTAEELAQPAPSDPDPAPAQTALVPETPKALPATAQTAGLQPDPSPLAATDASRDGRRLGRRVALVIGNGTYRNGFTRLPNPRNDASDVAAALASLGFEVALAIDATKEEMEEKLATFAKASRTAAVALAFYAGHAIQHQGINYLAPVDALLNDETDLRRRFVRVQDLIDELQSGQEKGARILLLDSCRDNEAVQQLAALLPKSRAASVSRGLAGLKAEGLLIAFSTQANRVAEDGEGRNSPFTQALLKHLPTPGLEIRTMFTRVRSDVLKLTGQKQRPEVSDSLDGEFAFN